MQWHYSKLVALMENYNIALDATSKAYHSQNSAIEENEKRINSIQGRIGIFKATTEGMWQNTLDSDAVKFFVDFGTAIITIIDKIGLLNTTLLITIGYFTVFKKLQTLTLSTLSVGSVLGAFAPMAIAAGIMAIVAAIDYASKANERYVESQKKIVSTSNESINKYKDETDKLISLQKSLQDAHGNKEKLLAISNDLNTTIGETKGLLEGESTAYDIANMKIQDRIRYLKEQTEIEKNRKISAQKEIFESSKKPYEAGSDSIYYLGGMDYKDVIKNLKEIQSMRDKNIETGAKEDSIGIKSLDEKIANYKNFLLQKSQEAKDIFEETIDNTFKDEINRGVVNSFIEGLIFGGEGNLDNINTKIQEFSSKLKGIEDLKEKFYQTKASGGNTDSIVDDIVSAMNRLKETYSNFPEIINLIDGLTNSFANLGKSVEKTKVEPLSLSQTINESETVGKNLKAITDVLDDFKEKGKITTSTLKNLNDQIGSLGLKGYENFLKVLSDSKSSMSDVQSAVNSLATEYLSQSNIIKQLGDGNKDLVVSQLELMGVTNAEEVATEALGLAKINAINSTFDFANATSDEVNKLYEEQKAAGATGDYLSYLEAQKILASNPSLFNMTSDEIAAFIQETGVSQQTASMINYLALQKQNAILQNMSSVTASEAQNLYNLAVTAGVAGSALEEYAKYKQDISNWENGQLIGAPRPVPKFTFDPPEIKIPTATVTSPNAPKLSTPKEKDYDLPTTEKPNLTPLKTDDTYKDPLFLKEKLKAKEQIIDDFEKENDRLNEKLQKAMEIGDIDLVNDYTDKITENAKSQAQYIADSALESRKILNETIVEKLKKIPELAGTNPEDWTDYDFEVVKRNLEKNVLDAENAKISQKNANEVRRAEIKTAFDQKYYNADKKSSEYDNAKQAYEQEVENLKNADEDNSGISSAKIALDEFNDTISTFLEYKDKIGLNEGEGEFSRQYAEQIKKINEALQSVSEFRQGIYDREIESLERIKVKTADDYNKLFQLRTQKMEEAHRLAEELRKLEFSEDSEAIKALQAIWWDAYNENQSTIQSLSDAIAKTTEQTTYRLQKQSEYLEYQVSQSQALVNATQKRFDTLNSLTDAQNEVNKQLAVSKSQIEWLSEEERERLFNEKDYAELTEVINELKEDTNELTKNYMRDINDLGKDEWYKEEAITKLYERKVALKEKELEIAKQQIDLQKKQEALNNALAEKSVRMLVAGQWMQVANMDNVKSATEALADSQAQMAKLETERTQQNIISAQQRQIDLLNDDKLARENQIKIINDAAEKMQRAFDKYLNPVNSINELTKSLADLGIPQLNTAVAEMIKTIDNVTGNKTDTSGLTNPNNSSIGIDYDPNVDYQEQINNATTNEEKRIAELRRNAKIDGMNLPQDKTYKYQKVKGYASGTINAEGGIKRVDEMGNELILHNALKGRYTVLEDGDGVFNANITKNLLKIGQYSPEGLADRIAGNLLNNNSTSKSSSCNSYHFDKLVLENINDYDDFINQLTTKTGQIIKVTNKM